MKKVLLLVVDALASRVVRPALREGRLPHLRQLVEAGWMLDSTPIFPSITPAATGAIATGCYPRESGITGAFFYDTRQDRVHYYGDDFWVVLEKGFDDFIEDFLIKLNLQWLQAETLFERVERAGMRAACLNYLWFRGDTEHKVHVPWLLRLIPGVPSLQTVQGPQILCLGDFVCSQPKEMDEPLSSPGGPFHRFGFDDASTAGHLLQLARETGLPEFTLAYFPDNDYRSHEAGPAQAVDTLAEFDQTLGRLIGLWGSLDQMLAEVAIVITGDHSQTDMIDGADGGINLDEVLDGFRLVDAGDGWDDGDELMVCPNMRAAQIYLRPGYWLRRGEIVSKLLSESRIDQVIWRTAEANQPPRFFVATADRGTLEFWPAGGDPGTPDAYGGKWSWKGALATIDGRVDESGRLAFADYPNAMERIATSFRDDVTGDLWVTARPGYELRTPRTSVHVSGSHGSLHAGDSIMPLIVAGAPEGLQVPEHPRSVDVEPLCLEILGITPPRPAGASHFAGP